MKKKTGKDEEIFVGSGNVFEDLGFKNPEEALAKAELIRQLGHIAKQKNLTQVQIGKILGIPQSKVSKLMCGHITGFSTDRLMRFLTLLSCDVEIFVHLHPRRQKIGKIAVRIA